MSYNLKKIFEPEIAAWIGALAPIFALVSIGISIALSPWFSWTQNALSDLGVSKVAPIFNSGLILTGILTSIFAIALAKAEQEDNIRLVGAIVLLFMGISTVGVGVFTEAFLGMHILFAFSCFGSLILSFTLFCVGFVLELGTKKLIYIASSITIIGFVAWYIIALSPINIRLSGVATVEALIAFPFFPLYIMLSIRLHRKKDLNPS
jgi:hypothetical membrane protein